MNKETLLAAVVALVVGLLGGYLVFSISGSKSQAPVAGMPGGGAPMVNYEERIAQTLKVVAQDPKNFQAWVQLGNDYFDTNQPQKSIEAYGKALEINPKDPNVLTDQAIMYRAVGWFDKAIANLEAAMKIDPKHVQSLFNLGIVYMEDLKQPAKAIEYWTRYLELDPASPNAQRVRMMLEQAKQVQPTSSAPGPMFR
jgi:cytochrome c-type biogenesis protein CcmH/NrfG